MCRNNLPVRNLLRGKRVQIPIICHLCNTDVEHVRHLLLECSFAQRCWVVTGGEYDTTAVEYVSNWVLDRLINKTEGKLESMAQTLWGIWFSRNKRVWEGKESTPKVAMDIGSKMISDRKQAQQRPPQDSNVSLNRTNVTWQPPDTG